MEPKEAKKEAAEAKSETKSSEGFYIHSLMAISPVDGRNRLDTEEAAEYFSEHAFFKNMLKVEVEYLVALSETKSAKSETNAKSETKVCRLLNNEEKIFLKNLVNNFSLEDAKIIQNIDRFGYNGLGPTNHDAKAVEYLIKMRIDESQGSMEGAVSLADIKEMIHFALTSNDSKDLALALMTTGFVKEIYLPALTNFCDRLCEFAQKNKDLAMKSRTHGQDSVPTTLGKEFSVFLERLGKETLYLSHTKLYGKLNGAVGNFNAHVFAAPETDWIEFSTEFVKNLGFNPNLITTQIEPGDSLIHLFQCIVRINNILLDLAMDAWRYISDDYLLQKKIESEVGSSTMPNKVNPIDFEHAEGCLSESNAKFAGFISKLQVSRLQRDLSDTPVKRGIGVAFAYSYDAVKRLTKGLGKLTPNKEKITRELEENYAVLAEAVQTLLRKNNYEQPYELLKSLTRGKKINKEEYLLLIESITNSISTDQQTKTRLLGLTPSNYLGYSAKITDIAVERWGIYKRELEKRGITSNRKT